MRQITHGYRLRIGRNMIELPLSALDADGTYQIVVEPNDGSSSATLLVHP